MFDDDLARDRADWPLLQNGAVNLFRSPAVLQDAGQALAALGYAIADLSCRGGWAGFQAELSRVLQWEAQFGYGPWNGNLDALRDGLGGYPFGPSRRAALILDDFHVLVAADPDGSHAVLDLLEASARDHLLLGNFLILLVRTDDPRYECAPIGARRASWNPREWLDQDRAG